MPTTNQYKVLRAVFGSNNPIDWREGWMAHSDDTYYIAWENKLPTQSTWGNGIMLDTNMSTVGFAGFNSELPIGVDHLIEANALIRYTGTGTIWLWEFVDFLELGISGNGAEIRVPAALIDNPERVRLFFTADNSALGGSTIDFYPDSVSDIQLNVDLREHWYTQSVQPLDSTQVFEPIVDGVLTEWNSELQVGDADSQEANNVNSIDWHRAYAGHDDTWVHLAYTTHQPIDLSWGYKVYIDSDNDLTTGFSGFDNDLPLGAEILIEGRYMYRYTGTNQAEWSWAEDTS